MSLYAQFFKIFSKMTTLWRHKFFIKFKYDLKHQRSSNVICIWPLLCKIFLTHSFMDRFWWKFVWMHNFLKCHFYVTEQFCDFYFKTFWQFLSLFKSPCRVTDSRHGHVFFSAKCCIYNIIQILRMLKNNKKKSKNPWYSFIL